MPYNRKDKTIPEFERFYTEHMVQVNRQLENRRKRYWRRIRVRSTFFVIAAISMPFLLKYIPVEVAIGTLAVLAAYAVLPVFTYRRHVRSYQATIGEFTGKSWEKIALKEILFSEVFTLFGSFTFRRDGMNANLNFFNPLILPSHDIYQAEDRLTGVFEEALVDICEGQLVRKIDGKNQAVFRGMFITIDLSSVKVKLRKPFKGETAVILHSRIHTEDVQERFENFESVPLPTRILEEEFDAFTTHKREAKELLSRDFLETLQGLSESIQDTNEQVTHLDDKIMMFFAKWLRPKSHRMDKSLPINHGTLAINDGVQVSFYDSKVQITIPYDHDLFEPNSILEPALNTEDIHLVYNMMNMLSSVIRTVMKAKDDVKG